MRELNHRVGNLFALAVGIVNMSARTAPNVVELARAVNGRLHALSASHSLVHSYSAEDADYSLKVQLSDTVCTILAPYISMECEAVEVKGPELLLDQETLSALSLVLHELGTNAMKYGAFSSLNGTVKVKWDVKDDNLNIIWLEKGGPKIKMILQNRGFGTKPKETLIKYQLKGFMKHDWHEDGLIVEISVPIKD